MHADEIEFLSWHEFWLLKIYDPTQMLQYSDD